MADLQGELANAQEENTRLGNQVSRLETIAEEKEALHSTIAATESELSELRDESGKLQEALEASDSKVRQLESTIGNLSVHNYDEQHMNQPASEQGMTGASGVPKGLEDYALGSVVSGAANFEVDEDIADLTSDLSEVLTPELQRELAAETPVAETETADTGREPAGQEAGFAGEGLFSRFNRKKKS